MLPQLHLYYKVDGHCSIEIVFIEQNNWVYMKEIYQKSYLWLIVAVCALGIAGLYSIFVAALRAPILSNIFPKEIFTESLIVHVNLSITVWFLCFLGIINRFALKESFLMARFNNWALACMIVGAVMITFAPFFGGDAHQNNYVPMLENFPFIFGIGMVFTAATLSSLASIFSFISTKAETNKLVEHGIGLASFGASFIFLVALICFFAADYQLKKVIDYYNFTDFAELLFWGFGHVMQFVYLQIYMFALIVLYEKATGKNLFALNIIHWLFGINLIVIIPCPLFFIINNVENGEYSVFFTEHMKNFGGISLALLTIIAVSDYIRTNSKFRSFSAATAGIICSVIIFTFGGIIGYAIETENAVVPAHYHGSVVAITIALMAMSYVMLEESNKGRWQIVSYFFGQILHIGGLAMAGGYGALRKTPGVELAVKAKFYLGIMGFGGMVTIVSGIIFVVTCINLFRRKYENIKG